MNDTQQKILELLSGNAQLSATKMAGQIGVTSRSIESNIKNLKERGILLRHGSPKSGYWEVRGGEGMDSIQNEQEFLYLRANFLKYNK